MKSLLLILLAAATDGGTYTPAPKPEAAKPEAPACSGMAVLDAYGKGRCCTQVSCTAEDVCMLKCVRL